MALTEDQLQEKRQQAADLVQQIEDEKQKQRELVAAAERQQNGDLLDVKIEELKAELDRQKALTAHQAESVGPAVAPEEYNAGAGRAQVESPTADTVEPDQANDQVKPTDAPPAPPATVKAAKANDQK